MPCSLKFELSVLFHENCHLRRNSLFCWQAISKNVGSGNIANVNVTWLANAVVGDCNFWVWISAVGARAVSASDAVLPFYETSWVRMQTLRCDLSTVKHRKGVILSGSIDARLLVDETEDWCGHMKWRRKRQPNKTDRHKSGWWWVLGHSNVFKRIKYKTRAVLKLNNKGSVISAGSEQVLGYFAEALHSSSLAHVCSCTQLTWFANPVLQGSIYLLLELDEKVSVRSWGQIASLSNDETTM